MAILAVNTNYFHINLSVNFSTNFRLYAVRLFSTIKIFTPKVNAPNLLFL